MSDERRVLSSFSPAGLWACVKSQPDLLLGIGLIGILLVILVPLPPVLVDPLLILNVTVSLLVLLSAAYVHRPLEFSVFPSLLLVITFFRLSLNIATTRLILGNAAAGPGAAGQVVATFGSFVGGDNLVIGLVVFTVIVVVQFLVITRGATRVSEVVARFQLDAMPGKQLSIDGDLSAGLIDQNTARERRLDVSREADFYGAMDGASKFVRGDAVAGILIMFVNLVGGVFVGVVYHGFGFGEALTVFGGLTMGDGLVSQVPALMVSISAALLVTRSAGSQQLGRDLGLQIFSNDRILFTAAVFLWLLVPTGMPVPAVLITSGACLACGTILRRERLARERETVVATPAPEPRSSRRRPVVDARSLLRVETLEIDMGYSLVPLLDVERDGDLLEQLAAVRQKLAIELGLIVPPVKVADSREVRPAEYRLKLRGSRLGTWCAAPDGYLAIVADGEAFVSDDEPPFPFRSTVDFEASTGLWIDDDSVVEARDRGAQILPPTRAIAAHLEYVVREHAAELLSREETSRMLVDLAEHSPALVRDLVPSQVKVGEFQRVLQDLLAEGVSIRDLETVLECVGDCFARKVEPDRVLEEVRFVLARAMTTSLLGSDGKLHVVLLDPALEEKLVHSVESTDDGEMLVVDPQTATLICRCTEREINALREDGCPPAILCARGIRRHLWKLLGGRATKVSVFSYEEVFEDIAFEVHATVTIESPALSSVTTQESKS
jgi:flagellar biosynthesis protein FlhA